MVTQVQPQRGLALISPYVPGKPIEDVKREYGLSDIIKLASNENALGPSPRVLAALAAALPQLNYYPDADAYDLRHAVARHVGVLPEQVRIGNGADGVIRELCEAFVDDGDQVIVSRSSFPNYDIGTYLMRGEIIKTPLKDDYRLDLPAMLDAITERTKLIFVCNPNNPTGTIVTEPEVAGFMARVPDHMLVVFDEAYYEFVQAPDYPQTLHFVREGRQNVMVLRTFSKVYGIAGIRLGYGVADASVLAPLVACGDSFPVNRLAQVAGVAALEDHVFVKETLNMTHAGLNYLYGEFERLGLPYLPSHTNFVLVHLGPHARAIFELMLRQGTIIRPCNGYDLPEFARITVGTPAQNERLIATLKTALEQLRVAA
jgi:histidinol-phosphate aminotransferase